MKQENIRYKITSERQALIDEAMKIRAKAREEMGPENINKLYYLLMGKFPEKDKI